MNVCCYSDTFLSAPTSRSARWLATPNYACSHCLMNFGAYVNILLIIKLKIFLLIYRPHAMVTLESLENSWIILNMQSLPF